MQQSEIVLHVLRSSNYRNWLRIKSWLLLSCSHDESGLLIIRDIYCKGTFLMSRGGGDLRAQFSFRTSERWFYLKNLGAFDPAGVQTSSATPTVYESEMEVEVYILLCRISIKYTGRADIVGQYRPGSQVQQPIPGCALKPRPLFRGCISHISRAVFKSRWNT